MEPKVCETLIIMDEADVGTSFEKAWSEWMMAWEKHKLILFPYVGHLGEATLFGPEPDPEPDHIVIQPNQAKS